MTQRSSVRILLVEDNSADARLVEILLSEAGSSADFEVAHSERFAEALQRLEEATFEVILLDLSLPDSSGIETVSRMRAAAPRTPMVVLSGQDDEEVALRAVQQGAQDYLIKGQGDGNLIARTIRYAIERRRAEEALRESEERFRLLVEGVEDYAIFMLDPAGRIVSWNDGAERIKGYGASEAIGEHFSVFYAEEDVDRSLPGEALRVAALEGRFEEEGLRVRKDGTPFQADVVITALRNEAGELRGFSQVTRDITARKEAEEALRSSLRQLADLKAALDESAIVAITDERGKITYVNDRFCEISKYYREELLGQDHPIFNSDYVPKELIDEVWSTIGRGEVWRGEIKNRDRDGSPYWIDMTIVPFLDEAGRPDQYFAICNDITTYKEAE
jgi:PAS domain S-box-containing protein